MKWAMFSFVILCSLLQFVVFYLSFRTISKKYSNEGLQSFFIFSVLALICAIASLASYAYYHQMYSSVILFRVCVYIIWSSFIPLFFILAKYSLAVSGKANNKYYQLFFWVGNVIVIFTTISGIIKYNPYHSFITGTLLLLISFPCYQILAKSREKLDLYNSFSFWIIMGYSICMFGKLPIDIYFAFFRSVSPTVKQFVNAMVQIPYVIMYSFFIKAFLCIKKR
jgi:hypothetical protein